MNLTLAISLFFVIAILYIIIIDVFTAFFKMTGMSDEKARFQVISLLTNSGYTTKESEIVVEVLARRKMARAIMLFGYVFSVTAVSVFINVLVSLPEARRHEVWLPLLVMSVILAVFLILKSRPKIRGAIDKRLEKLGRRLIHGGRENPVILMDEFTRGVVAKVYLAKLPELLAGKTLKEAGLPQGYGMQILFIDRNGELLSEIKGTDMLQTDDVILVFGEKKNIEKVFGHMGGWQDAREAEVK